MAEVAQELDENVFDLVRRILREQMYPDASEIEIASITADLIHEINEHGYLIVKG